MKKLLILLLLASCAKQKVTPTQTTVIQQAPVYKQFSVTGHYQYLGVTKNGLNLKLPFDVMVGDIVTVTANDYANQSNLTLTILLDGSKLDYCSGSKTYNKTFTIQ